jgi:hypothetical protein
MVPNKGANDAHTPEKFQQSQQYIYINS